MGISTSPFLDPFFGRRQTSILDDLAEKRCFCKKFPGIGFFVGRNWGFKTIPGDFFLEMFWISRPDLSGSLWFGVFGVAVCRAQILDHVGEITCQNVFKSSRNLHTTQRKCIAISHRIHETGIFTYFSTHQPFMWATFKTLLTFHSTGCLIGILIMAYYNPHLTG